MSLMRILALESAVVGRKVSVVVINPTVASYCVRVDWNIGSSVTLVTERSDKLASSLSTMTLIPPVSSPASLLLPEPPQAMSVIVRQRRIVKGKPVYWHCFNFDILQRLFW